jgi:predicted secreted protein
MRWTSALAIYTLFWAFSVFLVLPFGVRTTGEAGGEHVPGQAESAPHEFDVRRLLLRVTVVATVLFGLYYLNWTYGWITLRSVDVFPPGNMVVR